MKTLKILLGLGALGALAGLGFLYSGIYSMGAYDEHTKPVYWALETLRERSIAVRSKDIAVPPLDDAQMLLSGGADYNDMCAGCHLKPGVKSSDMAMGLYPQPPNLAKGAAEHGHDGDDHGDAAASAARQFWIIKHGLKMSGMPAWGVAGWVDVLVAEVDGWCWVCSVVCCAEAKTVAPATATARRLRIKVDMSISFRDRTHGEMP